MKLIVGLGNPGSRYELDRHNVGYLALDRLARRYASGAIARSRFHSAVIDASINGCRVLLVKPTTFMNRCGQSVAEAVRFYRLDPAADLLVLVDDIALSCGMIRLRSCSGAGGHNGLADIQEKLSTSDYARLRIGIDSPQHIPQREYVLGRFRPDQLQLIEAALEETVDAAACWLLHGIVATMNRFNRRQTA
ncbi:MAG: aminoacyl-tRNA hydrolase [Planctomycetes bacterium]|nr:aminoacyl-tRNA hydrolase [Planctomycetota bacterium]